MIKAEDIKVSLTLTEGYQSRFTEACLRQIKKRENRGNEEYERCKEDNRSTA